MRLTDKLDINFNKLDFFDKIIAINLMVFVLLIFLNIFGFHDDFIALFSFDSDFLTKPWSILTYSFIHGFTTNSSGIAEMPGISDLFDLLFMIILLKFTTTSIGNLLGPKISIKLFFTGIVVGAIFCLLINPSDQLIGASAGISSLLMFLFLLSPNLPVIRIFRFSIAYKYIMAFILLYDIVRLILILHPFIFLPDQYGIYAHIGGYLVGIYFYYSIYGFPKMNNKKKVYSKKKKTFNKQSRVDKILDKISKSGYDSLDKDEKEFLFKQGENK